MADMINFTLPSIDENTDEKTMKQIKNYLFQLTEQMKFYLNNIDSDNFTLDYSRKLSNMADSSTTNAIKLSVAQQQFNNWKNKVDSNMQSSINLITGNKGGYVILHDGDNDTFPDEILIMNTSDITTANKIWRWNKNGLMFNDGGYANADCWNTTVAIDMQGRINADFISAGTISGVTIEGNTIVGNTIEGNDIIGGTITGTEVVTTVGKIGGWDITKYGLELLDGNRLLCFGDTSSKLIIGICKKTSSSPTNINYDVEYYIDYSGRATLNTVTTDRIYCENLKEDFYLSGNSSNIITYQPSLTNLYFGSSSNDGAICDTLLRGNSVRLYSHNSGAVYLGYSGSIAVTSDEHLKNIYSIDDKYSTFFNLLQPVTYIYKNKGHRKHLGFGARAVEQALLTSGLTTEDFAGVLIQKDVTINADENGTSKDITYDELYSLRYEEFISLNTFMIQKLMNRVEMLESEIKQLKGA